MLKSHLYHVHTDFSFKQNALLCDKFGFNHIFLVQLQSTGICKDFAKKSNEDVRG